MDRRLVMKEPDDKGTYEGDFEKKIMRIRGEFQV
jgi:hypothetical protein